MNLKLLKISCVFSQFDTLLDMADSIQNRKSLQADLRLSQQEYSKKKRELVSQQKEDLQSLKSYYADKNRELDAENQETKEYFRSEDSVNHINPNRQRDPESEDSPSVERKAVYNRRGQKEAMVQNYETKETDRFYKVQDRGSRIQENGSMYVIEAYVPEHEQNNLRFSVQKDKAIISGQRKHQDHVDQGNKTIRTNNFQTFREEFKFDRPVSHEGMTRERVGDFIRFTIPKLSAIDETEES